MERDELAGWLRLALSLPIDGAAARRLLSAFGLPEAIFRQDAAALAQVVDRASANALREEPADLAERVKTTLAWLQADPEHRQVLTLGDPEYPRTLLAIEDPPLMLYRLGRLVPSPERALAIVGSRNPTPVGLQNARRFGRAF